MFAFEWTFRAGDILTFIGASVLRRPFCIVEAAKM